MQLTGGNAKMPHIVVSEECKAKLDNLKIHRKEPYGDVVDKLIQEHNETIAKENPSFEQATEQAKEIHKETHPFLEPALKDTKP